MQVSPVPESEWDTNTKALSALYTGPTGLPEAKVAPGQAGSTEDISGSVSGLPDADWDSNDTVGYGVDFVIGSFVQDTDTNILYRCVDDTPGAAIWYKVVQER